MTGRDEPLSIDRRVAKMAADLRCVAATMKSTSPAKADVARRYLDEIEEHLAYLRRQCRGKGGQG